MNNQARSIEASGSDAQAAIKAGLAQLGLTRDQVEVEVIQEPSRGVLGIGARDAIVRLTEIRPRPQEEPRSRPSDAPVSPPVKQAAEHPASREMALEEEAEELLESGKPSKVFEVKGATGDTTNPLQSKSP